MGNKKKKLNSKKPPLHKTLRGGSLKIPSPAQVNLEINITISTFLKTGRTVSYNNSWNTIIPAIAGCLKRLQKLKFQCEPQFFGIKRLALLLPLNTAINKSVLTSEIKYIHEALYFFIKTFNQIEKDAKSAKTKRR